MDQRLTGWMGSGLHHVSIDSATIQYNRIHVNHYLHVTLARNATNQWANIQLRIKVVVFYCVLYVCITSSTDKLVSYLYIAQVLRRSSIYRDIRFRNSDMIQLLSLHPVMSSGSYRVTDLLSFCDLFFSNEPWNNRKTYKSGFSVHLKFEKSNGILIRRPVATSVIIELSKNIQIFKFLSFLRSFGRRTVT